MLDSVHGLPTHPLLAHLVAVLVPVAALLAILVVAWPAARRRIGATVVFVATATMPLVPLTTAAGAWLRPRVMMGGAALDRHALLGGQLIGWVAALTIAVAPHRTAAGLAADAGYRRATRRNGCAHHRSNHGRDGQRGELRTVQFRRDVSEQLAITPRATSTPTMVDPNADRGIST